ncbi:MAG: hypothetical protein HC914_10775 [Chloroflexaceae bacterium]|nr:hypothetical protein [Chloroflexaceae bacterium]
MSFIYTFHSIFGERVLPILIVVAAVWFTVTWKEDPAEQRNTLAARVFPWLITWQFALGLIYWLYGIFALGLGSIYLGWPFILHPILGVLAVLVATRAARPRPEKSLLNRMLQPLGRWQPFVAMLLLFVIIAGNIVIAAG